MNPVAFQIGPLSVHWYGLLIGAGIMLALLTTYLLSERSALQTDKVMDGCIYMLPIAFLGARAYYVLFNLSYYLEKPSEIIKVWHGGLAIHGGVIAAIVFLVIYARRAKMDPLALLDLLAPGVILAQAIGRWGNFINQEAHGGVVSETFIRHFPEFIARGMLIDGNFYHPTFLYESGWNLVVFLILMVLSLRRGLAPGRILAGYLVLYSLGRFFIESLRTDSLMLGPLRVAQVVSLVGILVGLTIFWVTRKRLRIEKKD